MIEICDGCHKESNLLLAGKDGDMLCEECLRRERNTLPQDEFSSGNQDDKCWAKVYGWTREEAEVKMHTYFDRYPPQGYGTRVSSRGRDENNHYFIYMRRWHSCD